MSTTGIDGSLFRSMVLCGLNRLEEYREEVNSLNVFPVPDGDTGSNMVMTLKGGLEGADQTEDLSAIAKALGTGMLYGARGNSGVILSQFFSGLSDSLQGKTSADVSAFTKAFAAGTDKAYRAVSNPVEGTMLSVLRQCSEMMEKTSFGDFENLFLCLVPAMREYTRKTIYQLKVLSDAGVVDSGAQGLVRIFEGMEGCINGSITPEEPEIESAPVQAADLSLFNEDSVFEFGYCMEFILQLMNSKPEVSSFDTEAFRNFLLENGNSLVLVRDGSRVKVHVHVFNPAIVITEAQRYGEFVTFKLENMCVQHSETRGKTLEIGVITVFNGDIADCASIGDDIMVLDGGKTMSVSVADFVHAIEDLNANRILIFPNSHNVYESALQAAKMCGRQNAAVVKCFNQASCIYALNSLNAGDFDPESLAETAASMKVISVAKAVKKWSDGKTECREGDWIALCDSSLIACSDNIESVAAEAVKTVIEQHPELETGFVFVAPESDIDGCDMAEILNDSADGVEFNPANGCAGNCSMMIGLI